MRHLARSLAAQSGQLLNMSALAGDIDLSKQTVANYLWYLEQTFIIRRVTPYSRMVRHEIRKAPVVYFFDTGMRNSILGQASLPLPETDYNFLFQNVVGNILHSTGRRASDEVHFWRTKAEAEVDFVLERGREIIPIEVKNAALKKPGLSRSYQAFIERYQPNRGFVVNRTLAETRTYKNTHVHFIPWWKLAASLG